MLKNTSPFFQYSESDNAGSTSFVYRSEAYNEIADELALPPVKIHCSVLAEDAIKTAVFDYRKKQQA